VVAGGKGTAADKFRALEEAGVRTVKSVADLGAAMAELLNVRKKRRASESHIGERPASMRAKQKGKLSKPKSKAKTGTKVKASVKVKVKAKAKVKVKPKATVKAKAKVKTKAKAKTQSKVSRKVARKAPRRPSRKK
jgi:N-acetylmuramoyl-L-alanine amidase CwlA